MAATLLAEAEAALAAGDSDTASTAASLAASLVREPLLPGEDAVWVEGKRRELTDLHVHALDCLADACLRSGDFSDAARWAQEAIELEPFRESGYRGLMKAHAAAGNRGEALRTYERCRRFLADELGAYPSPETDSVYRELLATTPGHQGPATLPDPTPAALTMPNAESAPSEARKTLTVLFADLAGWMEIVERLDAEAADQLATRYYRETQRIVLRHGGIIEKSAGGVITAAFGFPVAHEDDALRAVRAALELVRAASALSEELEGDEGTRLALKVAVTTGDVFVSLEGPHGPRLTGDVVAIAARLEEEAGQPAEILIGSTTRNLVRGVVEAEALGRVALAGRAEPVEVWRVLGLLERSAPTRAAIAPFVGRERELAQLEEALAEATLERTCRLYTLVGPAGVGKSRLVSKFVAAVGDRATVLVGRCLSYGEGITYWPLAEVLKEHFELLDTDPPEKILERLGERRLLALTLGLEVAGELHPLVARDRFQDSWAEFLADLASEMPTIVLIEDLHWAEPPLLELIEWLRVRVEAPLLVVGTARPELIERRPGWTKTAGASFIELEPLSRQESATLIEELLAGEAPPRLNELVLDRSEGNPFVVEELVGMLIDRGQLTRESGRWTVGESAAEIDVPDSVQALLAARIDLLIPADKEALQTAAVIGRVFWTWTGLRTRHRRAGLPRTRGTRLHSLALDIVDHRAARVRDQACAHARGRLRRSSASASSPFARRLRRLARTTRRGHRRQARAASRPPLRRGGAPGKRRPRVVR